MVLYSGGVSRLRHSPPIALTEEDPTGGELPIGEVTLQSRSAPEGRRQPIAVKGCHEDRARVVAGSDAFLMRKEKKKAEKFLADFVGVGGVT